VTQHDAVNLSDAERLAEIETRIARAGRRYVEWAASAKRGYRGLNFLNICFAAAVPAIVLIAPLLGGDPKAPWVASVAGILGACATLAKSIDSLFKNHDTWLRNCAASSQLESEQFLFKERAGTYKTVADADLIATYASRIDAIIGSETTSWTGAEKAPSAG
jgi:hypothetical protein